MKESALKGYILEELIAYFIRTSGYSLLVDRSQDTYSLKNGSAGLEVRGKGAWHQADVLGQFDMHPAFTYPLRLFTEAKFFAPSKKVELPAIRNAVGTIIDVRSAPIIVKNNVPIQQAYRYEYALFSATGFVDSAVEMAVQYQLSLIDLSSSEYEPLLKAISLSAKKIASKHKGQKGVVRNIRYIIRRELRTSEDRFLHEPPDNRAGKFYNSLCNELRFALDEAKKLDRLYIGTVNAPFFLVLKPNNAREFEDYARSKIDSPHKVIIKWSTSIDGGGTWFIAPADGSNAYQLTFRIPEKLFKWIFESEKETQTKRRAMNAKLAYFSKINIYLSDRGMDTVVKLVFDLEQTLNSLNRGN